MYHSQCVWWLGVCFVPKSCSILPCSVLCQIYEYAETWRSTKWGMVGSKVGDYSLLHHLFACLYVEIAYENECSIFHTVTAIIMNLIRCMTIRDLPTYMWLLHLSVNPEIQMQNPAFRCQVDWWHSREILEPYIKRPYTALWGLHELNIMVSIPGANVAAWLCAYLCIRVLRQPRVMSGWCNVAIMLLCFLAVSVTEDRGVSGQSRQSLVARIAHWDCGQLGIN